MRASTLTSVALAGAAVVAMVVPGVASAQPDHVVPLAATAAKTVSAKRLLAGVHVRAESHAATYARSRFTLWVDADHDGENTRAEVLRRDSKTRVDENSSHTVKTGSWLSPYDGVRVTTAAKLDINHLVPLEEAWVSGAAGWSALRREAYANDLGYRTSLVTVTRHANRAKGDREPNAYLPPKRAYRCTYVKNYLAVKYRWGLSVDKREKAALTRDLRTYCASLSVGTAAVSVDS